MQNQKEMNKMSEDKNKKKPFDPLDMIADINCLMFGACKAKTPDLTEDEEKKE